MSLSVRREKSVVVFCPSTPPLGRSWDLGALPDGRARHLRAGEHFETSAREVRVLASDAWAEIMQIEINARRRVRCGRSRAGTGGCGYPPVNSEPFCKAHAVGVETQLQNVVSGHMHIKRIFAPDILLDIC